MQILCSTGVFTRSSDPLCHEVIVQYSSQFDVDGYEVIFYPRWYAEPGQIACALRASPAMFPALHVEKSVGETLGSADPDEQEQSIVRFERNCVFAQQIGARIVVLHLWGLPHSDTALERNLSLLPRCLDIAARHELELAIETIPCASFDPLSNVKRAIEQDDRARVALDTEFLAMHSQLDAVFNAAWLWHSQSPLVKHVHLKDFDSAAGPGDGRRYLHLGEGKIDFERFLRQLHGAGFDGALSLEARGIDGANQIQVARIQANLHLMSNLVRDIWREPNDFTPANI